MYWKKKKNSTLDVAVASCLLLLGAYIGYRLTVSLNYKWQWEVVSTYLIRFDHDKGVWTANLLLQGLFTTVKLSTWAVILAMILGLAIGLMRVSTRLLFRLIGGSYVELIRNTPPLVLVFIFYFFVSAQIIPKLGIEEFLRAGSETTLQWANVLFTGPNLITAFISGTITISLFQGAYIAEIVRAGIESIEKGQWEAAHALGFTRLQRMRYIILPQAGRRMLPALAGEFINTIKYSSIVSIISIQELTFQGLQIMASTHVTIEIWLTITLMYLLLCLVLSRTSRTLEKHLTQHHA